MIPDISQRAGEDYQIAILPHGPHFYTGILQSAGYLLLPQRKNLLLLIEQTHKDKEIYQITGTLGPILWHERKLSKETGQRANDFKPSIQELWMILQHLAYIQTITDTKEITCLAVGWNLSPSKQKKLNEYLCMVGSDTNIVFLSNVTVPWQANNFPISRLVKDNNWPTIKTFHIISKKFKRSSEIIAYAHGDKKGNKGYACILA